MIPHQSVVLTTRDFRDRLKRRARRAGVDAPAELIDALERYFALLARWSEKINLTSFDLATVGSDAAVDRLLIEPLAAARHVPASTTSVIDIGSGGGSPAIPLALALPRVHLRMVESKTRKAVFLREAIRDLGLGRATVETSRFETLLARPELHETIDLLTIRAVRIDVSTLKTLQAFLKIDGCMFLFRTSNDDALVTTLPPPLRWAATYPLVPALSSRLVTLRKYR